MKKIFFLLLIGTLALNSCGPSAAEKRKLAELELIQKRQAEEAERLRIEKAKPCYGVELLNAWTTRKSFFFTVKKELWVKVKNSSDMTKYVTISFYVDNCGGSYTKQIKVYAKDITEKKIWDDSRDSSFDECDPRSVEIVACE